MLQEKSQKIIKLSLFCILAAIMNILFSNFVFNFLKFPLYVDTVFSAAITFAFGLIPGLATAILSWLIPTIYYSSYGYSFYVLCSIAEVLIICALKPSHEVHQGREDKEKMAAAYASLAARLMVMYILCAAAISTLGGIINYVSDILLESPLPFYSVEDTFKLSLLTSNLPILAVNILSRIQVNIVDRFIVIFGGYFISRGLKKLVQIWTES